ncbi:hypothetical protein HDV05_000818 [Chytridiales sp. JEL 0842]|nr:hypothetical protein HDV05_000818 [Chytridiales sp. JEL 0842]
MAMPQEPLFQTNPMHAMHFGQLPQQPQQQQQQQQPSLFGMPTPSTNNSNSAPTVAGSGTDLMALLKQQQELFNSMSSTPATSTTSPSTMSHLKPILPATCKPTTTSTQPQLAPRPPLLPSTYRFPTPASTPQLSATTSLQPTTSTTTTSKKPLRIKDLKNSELIPPVPMRPDGKRRRVHASKEQLAFLEAAFQACQKPNSKARIEICKSIRMNTRSVQIWFQNRRAREKKIQQGTLPPGSGALSRRGSLDSLCDDFDLATCTDNDSSFDDSSFDDFTETSPTMSTTSTSAPSLLATDDFLLPASSSSTTSPPPSTTYNPATKTRQRSMSFPTISTLTGFQPTLTTHFETENVANNSQDPSSLFFGVNTLVGIQQSSFRLSTSSLVIGSWRRMSVTPQDLICEIDYTSKVLRWTVVEASFSFKMEVSFADIVDASLDNSSEDSQEEKGESTLTVEVCAVPTFSKEVKLADGTSVFIPCEDFTEGLQASSVPLHVLRGFERDLGHLVNGQPECLSVLPSFHFFNIDIHGSVQPF